MTQTRFNGLPPSCSRTRDVHRGHLDPPIIRNRVHAKISFTARKPQFRMFALKNRKQNLRKSPKLSLIRRKQSRSGSRTTRINITQWFARKGGRGTRRTRDRDMRVGEHRPMLMVPVSMYRVVPIRAVGADSGRWVRGRRQRRIKQRGLHGCAIQ